MFGVEKSKEIRLKSRAWARRFEIDGTSLALRLMNYELQGILRGVV
jgi:hypothetical protein